MYMCTCKYDLQEMFMLLINWVINRKNRERRECMHLYRVFFFTYMCLKALKLEFSHSKSSYL